MNIIYDRHFWDHGDKQDKQVYLYDMSKCSYVCLMAGRCLAYCHLCSRLKLVKLNTPKVHIKEFSCKFSVYFCDLKRQIFFGLFYSVALILWCSIVESHWALFSHFISTQFSWMLCWCFYGIHPHTVHAVSQADRKAAEVFSLQRGSVWLFITQGLWHHQSRKYGPPGSLPRRKMKHGLEQMKYAWGGTFQCFSYLFFSGQTNRISHEQQD